MWMIDTDGSDDIEVLACHICRQPFPALELAWLAWPVLSRRGVPVSTVWAHRTCLEGGQALLLFGTGEYRMKRADFVIRSVLQRLLVKLVV